MFQRPLKSASPAQAQAQAINTTRVVFMASL
jgi:hypothetical protein